MKLINYKCPYCGKEKELLYTEQELLVAFHDIETYCSECNTVMMPFNFKNNGQVWRFNQT